ncbi:MAG: DNA polymerase III subunit gamma/tau [Planctomycetes bacterium]|nr:DNA polymerase III subunit gamma/tau [Planctomycetota bacterium]
MAKRKSTKPDVEEPAPTPGAEYTVLARRYRPRQFAELIGQEPVAQALINALQSNRVAHAYIFTGARGVGKTSAARILAKALNCAKGPTPTPCDECEICQAITSGEDTDVLEIDGASNNGVDNIRELRANVQFRPSRSRYKIYIIDEVHMLSTAAFNALLKTLEEPPAHVKFIFATTEIHKVPITILSRCQRFDFGGISITRILDRLKEIVASEKMQADDEALETVARRAGGSMRDAQSLLDQLLAFSGQNLTVDTVHQLLGTAHEEHVTALAGAAIAKDTKKVLDLLNEIANQGQQIGELLDQLIEYWRDLMVVNCAGIEGQSVSVSSARRDLLKDQAKQPSLDKILAGMDILVTAKTRMGRSSHARAILEMGLVRICQLDDLVSITQIAQWLSREGAAQGSKPPSPARPSSAAASAPGPEKKKLADDSGPENTSHRIDLTEQSAADVLQQLISNSGFAVQAELRKITSAAISGPNALVFRVPRRYNAPSAMFLDPIRLSKVGETLNGIVGQPCKISIEWIDDAPREAGAASKSSAALAMGQQRQTRAGMMQLPFVKNAAEILGAQIMRVDEGFGAATVPAASTDEAQEEDDDV